MANPSAIREGSAGLKLDLIVSPADGVGRLKLAGDDIPVSGSPDSAGAPQLVQEAKSTAAVLANVAASDSSVTLQAANPARKGLTIFNDSTAILYVKCAAAAASATSFTVKLVGGAYWELPFRYTGEIRGIWASATGAARLTEFS